MDDPRFGILSQQKSKKISKTIGVVPKERRSQHKRDSHWPKMGNFEPQKEQ